MDALVPITDDQRQQIIDLHGQGLSRNDIARQTGVSAGSVTNICRQNDRSFDRSATKQATESKQIDAKAVRAAVASDSLNVAKLATAIIMQRLQTDPDSINARDLGTLAGIFTDKHLALAKHDAGNDTTATDSVVDQLLEGFRRQAGQ